MKFLTEKEIQKTKYAVIGPKKTVPRQSLSIKDILNNFTSEAYADMVRNGTYDEEANLDTVCFEDFKDIAELEFACANASKVMDAYERARARKQAQEVKEAPVKDNPQAIEK